MKMSAILRHYAIFHRNRKVCELDWFRTQPTLEAAIEKATLSIDEDGKRLSHQRRIKLVALNEAKTTLLAFRAEISNCPDFDSLHIVVEQALESIYGIGPLYVYDVSERIGAYLGLRPEKVYLHTGAAVGATRLGLDGGLPSINVSDLPAELRVIPADEIEDVLCIYKFEFE